MSRSSVRRAGGARQARPPARCGAPARSRGGFPPALSGRAARARRARGGCRPRCPAGASFWKIACTWRSTARGLRKSCLPIARLERPSAISESTSRSRSVSSSSAERAVAADEALHDLGVEGRAAAGDALDGVDELGDVAHAVLQQVADPRGVVADELQHVGRLEVLGEHEHGHRRVRAPDLGRRDQPVVGVPGRHPHVDDRDVRACTSAPSAAGRRRRRERPTTSWPALLQQRGDPLAQQRVVVGDDDAQRSGRRSRRLVGCSVSGRHDGPSGPATLAAQRDLQRVEHEVARILAETEHPVEVYAAALEAIGTLARLGARRRLGGRPDGRAPALRPHVARGRGRARVRGAQRADRARARARGCPGACSSSGEPAWIVDAPDGRELPARGGGPPLPACTPRSASRCAARAGSSA